MAESMSAQSVYDYIAFANNGRGMAVGSIVLHNQNVVVIDSSNGNTSFSSDVSVEKKYASGELAVSISDDQIQALTGHAIFWTTYCDCSFDGVCLKIKTTDDNKFIVITPSGL